MEWSEPQNCDTEIRDNFRLCARIRQPPRFCWVSVKRGSGFRGQAKAAESLWDNADRRFVGIPDPLEGQSCKWQLACGSALKSPCSLGSRRVPVTQPDCHESQESGSPEGSHLALGKPLNLHRMKDFRRGLCAVHDGEGGLSLASPRLSHAARPFAAVSPQPPKPPTSVGGPKS